jgi:hypothetical protein
MSNEEARTAAVTIVATAESLIGLGLVKIAYYVGLFLTQESLLPDYCILVSCFSHFQLQTSHGNSETSKSFTIIIPLMRTKNLLQQKFLRCFETSFPRTESRSAHEIIEVCIANQQEALSFGP